MLNVNTKKHIDAARDVLVGVAPNPTTQIDQITYALIYKFMDDMDQAAIKAGGKPSFFVDDLKEYAWSNLVSARLGNQEKLNLYRDALSKFSVATQLPELFRTIFRGAALPYSSSETLGLFLKEISFFDYTHPEELGNAYEYLLSIMSSQGDAGQFRTPRHIIDFIVDVINPTKDDKILDPTCGTAGFLVSTYNHILEQHDGLNDSAKKEKPLTPDDRKKLMQNLQGYDIDPTMVRIAQVNMYLHQFKNPQIFQYDSLTSEERWNDKFDVILANPPFMSPKGGIKPHAKFGVASNRSEVLFVDYILNHLKPKGRAGIIVPEGIIFQSGNAYKALRKNLVEGGLYAVISLPGGVFQPYSGVKTSILFLDNELAKQKSEIAFIKISADGYDLGSSKRVIERNDLPDAIDLMHDFRNGQLSDNPLISYVSKSQISETGDYNLTGGKYKVSSDFSNADWPMEKLGGLCSIQTGKRDANHGNPEGAYHFFTCAKDHSYIDSFAFDTEALLIAGNGDVGAIKYFKGKFDAYQRTYVLTDFKTVLPKYLYHVLSVNLKKDLDLLKQGNTMPYIKLGMLTDYLVPVPPLEIQQKIVAELDSYDAIISGANQIIDNWKPEIDIDPEWPIVELGDLCELITKGASPTTMGFDYQETGVNFVKVESISKNGELIPSKFAHVPIGCHEALKRSQLKENDVLFSIAGALGRTAVVSADVLPANINQNIAILRLKDDVEVEPQFLEYLLGTDSVKQQSDSFQAGVAQQVISLGQMRMYKLAMPSKDIQLKIIDEVKIQKNFVDGAAKLAMNFESRTQAVISKLWGQEEPSE